MQLTDYTSQEWAAEKLAQRTALRSEVEGWYASLGLEVPAQFAGQHRHGVLARQVATFRYEDALFVRMAEEAGLLPAWIEYTGDKMVNVSSFKRALMHPRFSQGFGRNGGRRVVKRKLANIDTWQGKPLNAVICDGDQRLVDFHHAHQDAMYEGAVRLDQTEWLKSLGRASEYYEAYLALFVAHAVLFEDYHGGESGDVLTGFTRHVFLPAYERVVRRFGVPPVIVQLPWWDDLGLYPSEPDWRWDAVSLRDFAQKAEAA